MLPLSSLMIFIRHRFSYIEKTKLLFECVTAISAFERAYTFPTFHMLHNKESLILWYSHDHFNRIEIFGGFLMRFNCTTVILSFPKNWLTFSVMIFQLTTHCLQPFCQHLYVRLHIKRAIYRELERSLWFLYSVFTFIYNFFYTSLSLNIYSSRRRSQRHNNIFYCVKLCVFAMRKILTQKLCRLARAWNS